MNKPRTAAKTNEATKAKAQSLNVKTKVKAGALTANRCELLRRKV